MTTYKGYTGVFSVDPDANVIRGKVVGLKDVITFQGTSVGKAKKAFRESVDDYLDFCATDGVEPERPYSGKFLVRINPRVHRRLSAIAESRGVSVNTLVTKKLTQMVRAVFPEDALPPVAKASPAKTVASESPALVRPRKSKVAAK
jgi:predicted HicB family RNase H-like nuclease